MPATKKLLARGAQIQAAVHRHLAAYPHAQLTTYELARVLEYGKAGRCGVNGALHRLADVGEVRRVPAADPMNARRTIYRWQVAP
ncbi:hypothetical protein Ssi03_50940 [Sphaerisporangium siamense]|uniref:Helix-turn-helix domain-containing protein n=1 Tax=Sphaerisporangium siamense TaxID=795645 RepID=A0A7W7GA97_9ACTN|nr:hypothetical protein [Sphaerisporangium siamense]MBB4702202.1 hypothetical protein [Sphaerisporangium siamense]GII87104.1 hypothetical protein Ssi03_50940 [Sphaerisporangium siamense]